MHLRPGTWIAGRYELVGDDGEAPGYRAFHALDHEVEVEVSLWAIRRALVPDEAWQRRLLAAAARARAANHAALRRLFESGLAEGTCWVAMQKQSGEPLSAALAGGAQTSGAELARLLTAIADGLAAGHAHGLAHGFLTPLDLVLTGGQPKISGVGLWANVEPGAALANWREWARYLAPEVARGESFGPAADVYSLAVLAAELALGGDVMAEGLPATALLERLGRQDPALAGVLAAGLAKDPERRPDGPLRLAERVAEAQQAAVPAGAGGPRSASPSGGAARARSGPVIDDDDAMTSHHVRAISAADTLEETGGGDAPAEPPIPLLVRKDRSAPVALPHAALPLPAPAPTGERARPDMTPPPPRPPSPPPAPTPPTIRAPRAPSHREGSVVLPAASPRRSSPRRPTWPIWLALAVIALAAVGLAVVLGKRDQSTPSATLAPPSPAPAGAAVPDAASAADAAAPVARSLLPCPAGMVLLADKPSVCVDAFEAPGEGFTPATQVTLAQAREACAGRGKRLCAGDDWERACRGEGGASYPYGDRFAAGRCNVRGGGSAALAAAGAFRDCISAAGAHDMAGNAAEWVEEGEARGGSAGDRHDGRCSRVRKLRVDAVADDLGYRCCAAPGAY